MMRKLIVIILSLNSHNDWRLPTKTDWETVITNNSLDEKLRNNTYQDS